jgi:hypothetical protein
MAGRHKTRRGRFRPRRGKDTPVSRKKKLEAHLEWLKTRNPDAVILANARWHRNRIRRVYEETDAQSAEGAHDSGAGSGGQDVQDAE